MEPSLSNKIGGIMRYFIEEEYRNDPAEAE
jgi:hypothetical protein